MAFFGGNGGDGEEADCADVIICDFKGLFCFNPVHNWIWEEEKTDT